MPSIKHIHKYRLINLGTKLKPRKVYSCAFPDCSHFMPTISQVLGKKTICWKCGKETIMSALIIRKEKVKPKCSKCRAEVYAKMKGKPLPKPEVEEKIDNAIERMFEGLK